MKKIYTLTVLFIVFNLNAQCWVSTSANQRTTFAIKNDGTLWACGKNDVGQVGDGTLINKTSFIQIGTATDWLEVSANGVHCLALKTNGTLWSWGLNFHGQLGDNTNINRNIPTQVGSNTTWSKISAGVIHSMAIKTDGSLWAWGYNDNCQLGIGGVGLSCQNKNTPFQVGSDINWQFVAAGDGHTLAIKTNGTLWAWGRNNEGQLGDNTVSGKNNPVQIGIDTNWKTASAGNKHSLGVKLNGTLWAWGSNFEGQLGNGSQNGGVNIPTQIGALTNWNTVLASDRFSLATKTDGALWFWGRSLFGSSESFFSTPYQYDSQLNWQNIGAGLSHGVGINDSSLKTWGRNLFGETGTAIEGQTPRLIGVSCASLDLNDLKFIAFSISPNPTNSYLNIETQEKINSISIIDLLGRKTNITNFDNNQIDVSNLQNGIYFIEISTENGSQVEKFIKN